jgi:hypothetical protein
MSTSAISDIRTVLSEPLMLEKTHQCFMIKDDNVT